ncbi:MAG: prolipoprotein diacylglyceryl transferase [Armatimonadetes bacterium]|nr:prolipoprotein diacylglyceryl transferase [Armatimonadota bacterium]
MRPILFTIGSFPIRAYGTLIVIGFLLAMLYIRMVCSRRMANLPEESPRRVHPDTMLDISVFTLFAGLLGARLLFVLLDFSSYSGRWLDIFKIWAGGMSLHGSLIGGVFALVYLARKNRIRFLVLSDLASPIFAVAYAFGRIGCFLNGVLSERLLLRGAVRTALGGALSR